MARTNQIQVRRGTATQWSNTNPVLASGEPGFDTTNSLLKVGDGTSTWSSLISVGSNLYSTSRGSETVTSNKSAFTVTGDYVSGNLDVYYNGLKFLKNDDFTETSSTVFTLTNPAVSGDVVEWVGLVGPVVGPATYQISDAGLTSIASLTTASGSYLYATANDVYTTGVITAFGRSLVDDADAATSRTTLGLAIGTDVQAYNSVLASTFAGGRLTLESGVAISTTDQSAKTTLYYTPYIHSSIGLYDTTNSVWVPYNFTQRSLALGTLSSGYNYDVFIYSNAGTLTLAASVWTSNTVRATAISLQDGVYVKTSDKSYRYLGTFRTTATTTTEDSEAKRFLYNCSNQVRRSMLGVLGYVDDNAGVTFTFNSLNAWAALNGGTGNKCEWVNGLTETVFLAGSVLYTAGASSYLMTGIGIDTTTSASFIVSQNDAPGGAAFGRSNNKSAQFTAGYHYGSFNGVVAAANVSATIYRDDSRYGGTVDPIRTFISGSINS